MTGSEVEYGRTVRVMPCAGFSGESKAKVGGAG